MSEHNQNKSLIIPYNQLADKDICATNTPAL